jgi:hypothetical protein
VLASREAESARIEGGWLREAQVDVLPRGVDRDATLGVFFAGSLGCVSRSSVLRQVRFCRDRSATRIQGGQGRGGRRPEGSDTGSLYKHAFLLIIRVC